LRCATPRGGREIAKYVGHFNNWQTVGQDVVLPLSLQPHAIEKKAGRTQIRRASSCDAVHWRSEAARNEEKLCLQLSQTEVGADP